MCMPIRYHVSQNRELWDAIVLLPSFVSFCLASSRPGVSLWKVGLAESPTTLPLDAPRYRVRHTCRV